ncbi:MAG: XRE family transcriptional regulator [Bacteroidales bacterium]|nr:XRE family transcriptional regulator [Bacteroidales bacterium]
MESLHIGNMIRAELKAQGRTVTWFAQAIHTDRTNVYKILSKETIDLQLLIRISKLLHRDFLQDVSKAMENEV